MTKRIVVVGAMHGGAWIASRIKRRLRQAARVTFINPVPELAVLPDITRSLAGGHPKVINHRKELSHLDVHVMISSITAHDPGAQRIFLEHGSVEYDVLVIDPDVEPDMSGVKGADEYAFTISSRLDAHELGKHIDRQIRRAGIASEEDRDAHATILVAYSDPQGVEAAFAIARRIDSLPKEPGVQPQLYLCETGLPGGTRQARAALHDRLMQAGVEVLEKSVRRIGPNAVWLSDKQELPCNTVVWTGHWQPTDNVLQDGTGVHRMDAENPYWPVVGRALAKDTASWVSSYLARKPRPQPLKEDEFLLRTPDTVLRVGDEIEEGPLQRLRAWRRQRKFLHL